MSKEQKQYEVLPDESYSFDAKDLEEGAFSWRGAAETAERVPAIWVCLEPATDGCLISSSSPGDVD